MEGRQYIRGTVAGSVGFVVLTRVGWCVTSDGNEGGKGNTGVREQCPYLVERSVQKAALQKEHIEIEV